MRARELLRRYHNSDREHLIDEKVHSDIGRQALKLMFIDGKSMMEASRIMNIPYPTFTDNYYKHWAPELFDDFGGDNP